MTIPRTGLDARRRGRLAGQLLPKAQELACLVHGDGDAEAIGEFLEALSPEERHALPVITAALVPVDQPVSDLLAWVDFDEEGRPLTAPGPHRPYQRPVSDLQPCGTIAAYQRHRNHGQEPCTECKRAKGDYTASRRAALRRAGKEVA